MAGHSIGIKSRGIGGRLTSEKEDGAENSLNNGNDQTSVNDKLAQFGRTLIRVATMPQQELGEIAELVDGEIRGEGSLFAFFTNNSNPCRPNQNLSTSVSRPRW